MADAITIQALQDASLDAKSLEEVVNGSEEKQVTTRLGESYPSVKKAIKTLFENGGLPATPFATKALMEASLLVDGDYAAVTNDPIADNNALYIKQGSVWVESRYNSAQAALDKVIPPIINKAPNGYLEAGTKDWEAFNGSISINPSAGLEITANTISTASGVRQGVPIKEGHRYLVRTKVKVDSALCQQVYTGNGNDFIERYIDVFNPKENEWVEITGYLTAVRDKASTALNIGQIYKDSTDAANKVLTVEHLEFLDVTEITNGITILNAAELSRILGKKPHPYAITPHAIINNFDALLDGSAINSRELFDKDLVMQGALDAYSGKIVNKSNVSNRYTGFINVFGYEKLELSGFKHNNFSYAFYDENKNTIAIFREMYAGTTTPNPDSSWVLNGTIDVPDNAHYFVKYLSNIRADELVGADISIKGVGTNSASGEVITGGYLPLSDVDKNSYNTTAIYTNSNAVLGLYTNDGLTEVASGDYTYSGLIDASGYDYIELRGFTSYMSTRYWLDSSGSVIGVMDVNDSGGLFVLNGLHRVPKNAKYFVANISAPNYSESEGIILGANKLNSSDFLKRGEGGDALQGWGISGNTLKTAKTVDITNKHFPEIKPLRIIHYGKANDYTIGGGYGERIEFDTEIYRLAWGIQIAMNVTKPNVEGASSPEDYTTTSLRAHKTLNAYNGLVAEHGVEGFSWHVAPPNVPWGTKLRMMFKIGGEHVRSDTNYAVKNKSIAQFFVPTWSERTDQASGAAWSDSSNNTATDDDIPTRTMIRSSAHFRSPEYYRISHSNVQTSSWDRFARTRGTVKAPLAAQSGDIIHSQVFSVGTGAGGTNPELKDVAKIDIIYNDDGSKDAAKIVFKTWNNVTSNWEEKLVL